MTLKEISKLFFKSYKLRVKKNSCKKSEYTYFRSFSGYSDILKKDIKSISESRLIDLQNHLKTRYTNNTATRMYYLVINVFDFAKKIGEIDKNTAKEVKSLKLNRSSCVKDIVSEENFYKMLHFIKDLKQKIFLELIFVTGLRSAEARALTWEDIDFKNSMLTINKSVNCQKIGKYTIGSVKTKSSNRKIMIDSITLSLLEKLRNESSTEKDFVFNKNGFPQTYNYCKYSLKRACKKANINHTSIHNLRHSHATNMLLKKVPISIISRRLGHSKTSITEDLYIHLIPNNDSLVIERLQYRNNNSLNV